MDAKAKQNKKKEISTPMYDEKRRGVRITKEEKAQRELNAHTHTKEERTENEQSQ